MVGTKDELDREVGTARRLWTRNEYEPLIERGILGPEDHVELIGGEVVLMTPQKGRHATAVGFGQDVLLRIIGDGFHLRVQLPLALSDDSEPEPELAVIVGRRRDYPPDLHPSSAILVVEVSDSSLAFDRTRKGGLYARSGIPEYWILNLQLRSLEVYRDPAPDPSAPFSYAYQQRHTFGPDDRAGLLMIPGAVIAVADLLP
jgi:Uma2 family endonuclease